MNDNNCAIRELIRREAELKDEARAAALADDVDLYFEKIRQIERVQAEIAVKRIQEVG